MAETKYISALDGPELDAALRDTESVDAKVQQAQTAAQQAAQSASSAQSYASQASGSASTAGTAASTATSKARDAQTAAGQAAESASQAAQSAAGIAGSVSAAQSAAEDAEEAKTAAETARAAAEDAAERAEQIADFDPADFATAAQGAKADSAVQSVNGIEPDASGNVQVSAGEGAVKSVNGKDPDDGGNVQLTAADVGAATAAQGGKADTAVQPADLEDYAKTGDIPSALPNPNSLLLKIGTGSSYYNGQNPVTATITPDTVGAADASHSHAASDISSGTLPVSRGGTGASTASSARSQLGAAPVAHASSGTSYGKGSSSMYGHVKLSDTASASKGVSSGVAATPKCVADAVAGVKISVTAGNTGGAMGASWSGTFGVSAAPGSLLVVRLQRENGKWTTNLIPMISSDFDTLIECHGNNNQGINALNEAHITHEGMSIGSWYNEYPYTGALGQNLVTAYEFYVIR